MLRNRTGNCKYKEALLRQLAREQNMVKTTVFLADMNDFAAMNAVYARYFEEAIAQPVPVSRFPVAQRCVVEMTVLR